MSKDKKDPKNNVIDIKEAAEKKVIKTKTVLMNHNSIFRMPFEDVDNCFWIMMQSFYPDGIPDDGMNDRVRSVWIHFLTVANWNEDEFWEEMDRRDNHTCPQCESEQSSNKTEIKSKKDNQPN